MKSKKNNENLKPAQAEKDTGEVMEELDDAALNEFYGAGNPFQDRPRTPLKPIDNDLRNNG